MTLCKFASDTNATQQVDNSVYQNHTINPAQPKSHNHEYHSKLGQLQFLEVRTISYGGWDVISQELLNL